MSMSFTRLSSLLLVALTTLFVGCDGTEYVVVTPDPDVRQVGEACVLDSECEGGRCVGGVCDDGLCSSDDPCREAAGERDQQA